MQPGETITPNGVTPPAPSPAPTEQPIQDAHIPDGKQYDPGADVTWTASEYIAHHKTSGWYVLLILGAAILSGLVYLLTNDIISSSVILVVSVIFAISASRQPRTLSYTIGHDGIQIGQKMYPYESFKSFSVIEEDAIYSILLSPMKRFMPAVSLYYPPDLEEEILMLLSDYLPHETKEPDMVDRLSRKLRF